MGSNCVRLITIKFTPGGLRTTIHRVSTPRLAIPNLCQHNIKRLSSKSRSTYQRPVLTAGTSSSLHFVPAKQSLRCFSIAMSDHQYTGDEGKEELRIVSSLVKDSGMTVEATIDQLTQLTLSPTTQRGQLEDHCYYTVRALLRTVAITAPQNQSKLIALLHRLRRTTINKSPSNAPLKHDGKVIWTGLPTFGPAFADTFESIPGKSQTRLRKLELINIKLQMEH